MTRAALLTCLFLLAACAAPAPPDAPPVVGLANPASVHCQQVGGHLEIRRESGPNPGEFGVCVFADGRQCEEWALFRDNRCVAP
ncbi:MAG TPA: DUF333 domain-containing protein [Brevundimonas sp.]|jgi:putative hemolysin|uniref:putative hemolysin n=1 Tax=Brevundimonas sp. TaxID=1871086 RepID=UPI002C138B4E|nr:DUF333 domain-containing protein [Brevundimonas sp.]HRH19134.1 DUF333 domain-containing protein [Brevundimonas sp.]